MKLIDLDKVASICDEDNNVVIFTNIKNAEVKAIPIEWLKKWEGYEQGMAIVNLKDIVEYWEEEHEID